jgi:hypothetical protein
MIVSPRLLKDCDAQIGTMIISKWIFKHTIVSNENGWEYGGFGKEMEEVIERTPTNLKENLGSRLPNAPMTLESCDVGLTFQLKRFEFIDSMNQEL